MACDYVRAGIYASAGVGSTCTKCSMVDLDPKFQKAPNPDP
jgi:hypothetical protein